MKTEKSIIEWLNELPEGIRELALANYEAAKADEYYAAKHKLTYRLLCDALNSAFLWQDSPEGGEFWADVWKALFNNKPLPTKSHEPTNQGEETGAYLDRIEELEKELDRANDRASEATRLLKFFDPYLHDCVKDNIDDHSVGIRVDYDLNANYVKLQYFLSQTNK